MAAPPASGKAAGVNRPPHPVWRRADVVRMWEELIDTDPGVAEEVFFAALLRDARAEHEQARRRAWMGPDEHGQVVVVDAGEEEERRRARVFQPWEPSAPGSALPPPSPVNRTVVLGLRAPPHLLASKHGMGMRTPSSATTAAAGTRLPSEHVKKPPAM
nr:unnamed protein product [Digitaria exilis]